VNDDYLTMVPPRWRIGILGIAIECSTFTAQRTRYEDFRISRGDALLRRYGWIEQSAPALTGASSATWSVGVSWVPVFHAVALPGGSVEADAYRRLETELLSALRGAGSLDGVLADIHGAMHVVGMHDAEAGLLAKVRAEIGDDALVSLSMDLHGNMSRALVERADLVTCYRRAPHSDAAETRERAARNLVKRLRAGGRPSKAWLTVPVLLPGERTSTRVEPARRLYAELEDVEADPGILDAALFVGYAWGDEPRSRAAVVVTGDDAAAVKTHAERLGRSYFAARGEFQFCAPVASFDEALERAISSDARPFFISDSGDNPTAGGGGDVSYGLSRLLASRELARRNLRLAYASIYDPAAVAAAIEAGVGTTISVELGGHVERDAGAPVELTATVEQITRRETGVGGVSMAGDAVVLRAGELRVVVVGERMQFGTLDHWRSVGIEPAEMDLVVVKLGYLEPELYDLAADWIMALSPGGVDQGIERLFYERLERPVYPLDAEIADPAIEAVLW
jgi:microcystin degradation protein MlrC